jgi:PAS domain S-box-containing protein
LELIFPKLKHGQRVQVTGAPIKDKFGKISGAIQTVQPLQTVQEARGMESDLRGFENSSFPIPVFIISVQGAINFWNKACEKAFGYPASQVLGKDSFVFVSKSYQEVFKATIKEVLQGRSFDHLSWKYRDPDGKPVFVIAKAYPMLTHAGKDLECVITNTDITNIKLHMIKLERHAVKSNEKIKTLSEEYELLKKNIASFIRPKDKEAPKK